MENTYYNTNTEPASHPMQIRQIKSTARENLLGNYKYIIIAALFIQLVGYLINSFFTPVGAHPNLIQYTTYYVATFIISLLMNVFYSVVYVMHLKAGRGEAITYGDLAFPVKNGTNRFFGVSFVLAALNFVVQIPSLFLTRQLNTYFTEGQINIGALLGTTILSIILLIVFIVCMLGFAFSYFYLIDNPQMGALDALSSSWKIMKGQKKRLFLLFLSFIGLWVLSIFTCMIAFLWVQPYMEQSMTVLYETLTGPKQQSQTIDTQELL